MPRFVLLVLCVSLLLAGRPAWSAVPEPRPLDDPALATLIGEVHARTARLRGHPDVPPVPAYLLETETLEELVREMFRKEYPGDALEALEAFLASLGVLEPGQRLTDIYLSLLSEQVAGLYDPYRKRLFVREGFTLESGMLGRLILSHEICHAIQDAVFDLEGMEAIEPGNADRGMAALAVVEGDAMVTMNQFALTEDPGDLLEDLGRFLGMEQQALAEAPHLIQQQLFFPYLQGQIFVEQARARGADWADRIFRDPPRSTEQLIHPEKYFGEEPDLPGRLETWNAPAPGDALSSDSLGEWGLRALLEPSLGAGLASEAAAGWDGDAWVVLAGPGDSLRFRMETLWDTPDDAREFADAWIAFWRSRTGAPRAGEYGLASQDYRAGPWRLGIRREGNRLWLDWRREEG